MKKSHLILSAIILVSIAIVGFKTTTQETKYEYASVRMIEAYASANSNLTIAYPGGTNKRVALGNIKVKDLTKNLNPITETFNKLGEEGYKLVSSNSNSGQNNTLCTTYIFIKE